MQSVRSVRDNLRRHRQQQLLAFYDQLSEAQRAALLQEVASIDFDRLDGLIRSHVLAAPPVAVPARVDPPPVLPPAGRDQRTAAAYTAARRRGEQLIAAGQVAAVVVAGGQGTRLSLAGPKGCLPATPVKRKPLFQLFAEQIRAASRRYGAAVAWYVMTSFANDAETRQCFADNDFFGLNGDDVFFFVQGRMPAVSLDGKILLAEKGGIAFSPDGHGGCLGALRESGALEDMARRGVELISYFQVDNPLAHCVDPLFIGLHAQAGADMSAKAVPKRDPMERLGNFCLADGKVVVIEYSDLPEQLARATRDDGQLLLGAGSIAMHVISRQFVERLTAGAAAGLPWHRAVKKVPCVDASGADLDPAEPNAVKLERFIFDALPLAENVVILQTSRGEEFSPIKNSTGADSLQTSLRDQIRRASRWLASAGVAVPRDAAGEVAAAIEISPLLALDGEQLAERLPAGLTIKPGQEVYLE